MVVKYPGTLIFLSVDFYQTIEPRQSWNAACSKLMNIVHINSCEPVILTLVAGASLGLNVFDVLCVVSAEQKSCQNYV